METQISTSCRFLKNDLDNDLFMMTNIVENAKGTVLIVTPFGKTSHDMFLITHNLNCNGFNVIRFDPCNHHGFSSGIMLNFTLNSLYRDTCFVLEYLKKINLFPQHVIGMSLSFPIVLRCAAEYKKFESVIGIVGVVDPNDTGAKAIERDLDDYRTDIVTAPPILQPFGCDLVIKDFVDDMNDGFLSLDQMIDYANTYSGTVSMISAENDEYVEIKDVEKFCSTDSHEIDLTVIPRIGHELGRSYRAIKKTVSCMLTSLLPDVSPSEINTPSITKTIALSEREVQILSEYSSDSNCFPNEEKRTA